MESSIADNSTTTWPNLDLIAGDCWPRRQPHSDIRPFPLRPLFMMLLYWMMYWRSQNSMADSCTTSCPILDLIAGGCWAWRQLCGGIRYVSVASKPMNPPTLLRLVFLKVHELNSRLLHNRGTDSGSDCRRLLASVPASQWDRILPPATFIHDVTVLNGVLVIPELDGWFL